MPGLPDQLTDIYTRVRDALARHDLDAARPFLNVPAGEPDPTAEQTAALVGMMPDIAAGRFLVMKANGDRVGLYFETDLDNAATSEVSVVRFEQRNGTWGLCRDTFSSSSFDRVSPAELLQRAQTDADLQV